ncbi:Siroheme synthase / Precorrin-2 oxidase / Sirohydrochlorin ferrochelatase / Uroporphyrinogen-III methyltransferase [Klebsiella pneumoniae IS53]|nr:Siroheme synthase / Precorrin-2 oxidase / Sirohydrochlorin ferrochelatase / Uroporphyrinogen-III methyltransferase [Klebsiella pneumoniae IS53]
MLVIGGGEIAERKIKFLLRAQAQVQVVAETLSPALADLGCAPGTQLAGDGIQRLAGG